MEILNSDGNSYCRLDDMFPRTPQRRVACDDRHAVPFSHDSARFNENFIGVARRRFHFRGDVDEHCLVYLDMVC